MTSLQVLHIFQRDYPLDRAWGLVEWCYRHGAEEFTLYGIVCDGASDALLRPFDQAAAAHKRQPANRRRLSWGQGDEPVALTELWSLSAATLAALRLAFPYGPFDYRPADAWFEDLALYRGGELMLGLISHEHEGILRVTEREQAELATTGFPVGRRGAWVGY